MGVALFFFKNKLILGRVSSPGGCHPGLSAPPPSDATDLLIDHVHPGHSYGTICRTQHKMLLLMMMMTTTRTVIMSW